MLSSKLECSLHFLEDHHVKKKTKNLLGLVAAGATLASSSLLLFAAKPAQAASLTNNWSFSGLANTGGTFVASDDATGRLRLLSIAGTGQQYAQAQSDEEEEAKRETNDDKDKSAATCIEDDGADEEGDNRRNTFECSF